MLRTLEFVVFSILLLWFLCRTEILADWVKLPLRIRWPLAAFFFVLALAQVLGVDQNFNAQGGAAFPFIRTSMFSTPPSNLNKQKSLALEVTGPDGNQSLFEPAVLAWSLASNWRYATAYHLARIDENPETSGDNTRALQAMLEGWARVYSRQHGGEEVSIRLAYRDVRYQKGSAPLLSTWSYFP